MDYSDDKLSAFLDGELPDAELEKISAAVRRDPDLQKRLFSLQAVDTILSETFSDIVNEPVPERILKTITATEAVQHGHTLALRGGSSEPSRWLPFLLILSALLLGLLFGRLSAGDSAPRTLTVLTAGPVDVGSPVYVALETTPSGDATAGFTPQLSFDAVDGGVCRELTADRQRALACRSQGTMTILAVGLEAPNVDPNSFQTASASSSVIFDVLADQLMVAAPLDPGEEASRLQAGWDASDR